MIKVLVFSVISTVGHVAVEVGDTVHIPCKYEDKYKNNVKYLCRGSRWGSIVTFTIKNLQFDYSDYYWCNIEKSGNNPHLFLGESKLHVDSQWTTYFGDQVVIYCKYRGSGSKQWCRVGGDCVSRSGQIDGALVTTDTNVSGVFAVTMTGLTAQNIGWYWCSSGDLQMPVFVDVTVRPTTSNGGVKLCGDGSAAEALCQPSLLR
uniref:Immunoglobulin domain-containing protein n=1 Tax=Neogobius melanostomus TaxID=47308 RepID=A0A8C6TUX2_9GOBI